MNGKIVKHVPAKATPRHTCYPPGWFARWRRKIGLGSIWQCDCGKYHRFTESKDFRFWIEVAPPTRGI